MPQRILIIDTPDLVVAGQHMPRTVYNASSDPYVIARRAQREAASQAQIDEAKAELATQQIERDAKRAAKRPLRK